MSLKSILLGVLSLGCVTVEAQMGIVGGAEAESEAYPWMCSIVIDHPSAGCGASLIRPKWVLTAGHCELSDFGITSEQVLINSLILDLDALEPYSELIDIEDFIIHEDYDMDEGFGPDIALIRLSEASTITPIELATLSDLSYYEHGDAANVLGWGTTLDDDSSDELLLGTCHFFGDDECGEKYDLSASDPSFYDLNEGGNICAGYFEGEDPAGAASGDSGGPLFFTNADGDMKQVGVVSGGESTITLEEFPGVFTLVPAYIEWIESTIAAYDVAASIAKENRENLSMVYVEGDRVEIKGLSANNLYDLAVYDSRGVLVYSYNMSNTDDAVKLYNNQFSNGIYIARVLNQSNGKVTALKFVMD